MTGNLLKLPDVTLVMQETREHELARLAVEDCLGKVEFGDVLIITDRQLEFSALTVNRKVQPRFHIVDDWPDKTGWARAMWFVVPPLVRTGHMLCIQWDSWVWDPSKWRNDWLRFDYIGAPWPFHSTRRVGNSGFSLKSTRLARYIRDRRTRFPCDTSIEDDLLCRKYRHDLEQAGFIWAPEWEAERFSFECAEPPKEATFGFHGAFNFGVVLERQQLLCRARLMSQSSYLRESPMMQSFCRNNPAVVKDLLEAVAT